ncbi:hypothetical protein GGTG_08862 [Gaeumannomyces tritici R3-111a-1]|uniref:Arylsulfotransferase n=1 Tax=Gaeumannomyces tritici (strain R3-111a-1) TaxID=644352 RepID=J3P5S2_GAET3|nr:hypothetical protein GGTG_08862 [Gaeumannomyces tritici R3-111a-1]EJT75024.1 hypothetical protein GGTG_08862 [Gaeumannomyces tritici R3-111a-1]
MDPHEVEVVDEKTALVLSYHPTMYDLTPFGGSKNQTWLLECIFQEVDIETGNVLSGARSLDFSSPADSTVPITGTSAVDSWDYMHINSVDKDDEGNYLVSGRHTLALYKISGRDGSLTWQLGGNGSNFSVPESARFGYQHDVRFVSRSGDVEVVSMFDNSAGGPDPSRDAPSRARVLRLDHGSRKAEEVQTLRSPDRLVARAQGSHQILGNGNRFVNWGQAGAITEFDPEGNPIFNAPLDSGRRGAVAMSYRAYRFEWEGKPIEKPAIAALQAGNITVYTSWNGDTSTRAWRFYGSASKGSFGAASTGSFLGEVARKSFETSLVVPNGNYTHFLARLTTPLGASLAVQRSQL